MRARSYDFINPIEIDNHVFPFLAVIDMLRPYLVKRDKYHTDQRLMDKYIANIRGLYGPTERIDVSLIVDLLVIHKSYIDAPDREHYLSVLKHKTSLNRETYSFVHETLDDEPDINMYDFIRAVNLRVNEICDDRIIQREDGTYYIDNSWEDISDFEIDNIIKRNRMLRILYKLEVDDEMWLT